MNVEFNRQFFLLDFRLLDNGAFLKFLGASECPLYFLLRRHVWRSSETHFLGLDRLYANERKLVCSLTREKIAEKLGLAENYISNQLKVLEDSGLIKRIRTGRQTIFELGEWIDVLDNGAYRGVEWFYLEGEFGIGKADLSYSVKTDSRKNVDQNSENLVGQRATKSVISGNSVGQISEDSVGNNIEANRSVNVFEKPKGQGFIKSLPNLDQPEEKSDLIARDILSVFGDEESLPFYRLVAAKIPEEQIRKWLSESKKEGKAPARLFTSIVQKHVKKLVLKDDRG